MIVRHNLAVVPCERDLTSGSRDLYKLIARHLRSHLNQVVLIDDDSKVLDLTTRLQNLRITGARNSHPLAGCIESGRLTVLRVSDLLVSGSDGCSSQTLVWKLVELLQKIEEKASWKNIIVIKNSSSILSTALSNDICKHLDYERRITKFIEEPSMRLPKLTEVVCYYDAATIQKLPFRYLISFIAGHDSMISRSHMRDQTCWEVSKLLECVSRGINRVMGEGSDELIFLTLKFVYEFRQEQILSNPASFEAKLTRILGNSAKLVLDSISAELCAGICHLGGGTFELTNHPDKLAQLS